MATDGSLLLACPTEILEGILLYALKRRHRVLGLCEVGGPYHRIGCNMARLSTLNRRFHTISRGHAFVLRALARLAERPLLALVIVPKWAGCPGILEEVLAAECRLGTSLDTPTSLTFAAYAIEKSLGCLAAESQRFTVAYGTILVWLAQHVQILKAFSQSPWRTVPWCLGDYHAEVFSLVATQCPGTESYRWTHKRLHKYLKRIGLPYYLANAYVGRTRSPLSFDTPLFWSFYGPNLKPLEVIECVEALAVRTALLRFALALPDQPPAEVPIIWLSLSPETRDQLQAPLTALHRRLDTMAKAELESLFKGHVDFVCAETRLKDAFADLAEAVRPGRRLPCKFAAFEKAVQTGLLARVVSYDLPTKPVLRYMRHVGPQAAMDVLRQLKEPHLAELLAADVGGKTFSALLAHPDLVVDDDLILVTFGYLNLVPLSGKTVWRTRAVKLLKRYIAHVESRTALQPLREILARPGFGYLEDLIEEAVGKRRREDREDHR
jgi:hypothetical protein